MARVLIANSHESVRSSLHLVLEIDNNITIVGEAETTDIAFQLCAELRPDIVLIDLYQGEHDGAEVAAELLQQYPHIQVILMYTPLTEQDEERARASKASALVRKEEGFDSLVQTIHELCPPSPT